MTQALQTEVYPLRRYMIRINDKDWVALDHDSGGYPYSVPNFERAKQWDTLEDVEKYAEGSIMSSFESYRIIFVMQVQIFWSDQTELITERANTLSQYEEELEAPNKKYGRD